MERLEACCVRRLNLNFPHASLYQYMALLKSFLYLMVIQAVELDEAIKSNEKRVCLKNWR